MRLTIVLLVALVATLAAPVSPASADSTTGACAPPRTVVATTAASGDSAAIPEPNDLDCDQRMNGADNCPEVKNYDQSDVDGDGFGDACDPDADGDGVSNDTDTCDLVVNPGQEDADGDGVGDACLVDFDRDGVLDGRDNCPRAPNPDQADTDGDRYGDACEGDDDDDYVLDTLDNCPLTPNPDQADADSDAIGDACDPSTSILTPPTRPTTSSGGGGGLAPAPDLRAPTLGLRAARTQRSSDAAGGMPILARCSEACAISAKVTLSARDARRLKVARSARKPVIVASGEAALDDGGSTYVFLDVTRAARQRLFKSRAVRATLEVRAVDGAGNRAASVKRTLLLRR